jgi:hypothetical protein
MHARSSNGRRTYMQESSHTRWAVAAFTAGVLTVLGFLAVADRARIENDANRALILAIQNDKDIAIVKTDISAIRIGLADIQTNQKAMLEALQVKRGK